MLHADRDIALYSILSVLDENTPPGLAALAESLRDAVFLGADWVAEVIAGPHPSRKGRMCPFVPKAIDTDRILFGIEQAPCADVEVQQRRYQSLADRYLGAPPRAGSKEMLTTLLIMYPYEDTGDAGSVVSRAVRELKFRFLEARRMIGVFTFEWLPGEDVPGGDAASWRNPMSVLAMRHMVQGDDFFLNTNAEALAIYRRHYPG